MAENVGENLENKYKSLLEETGQFNAVEVRRLTKALLKYEKQVDAPAAGTQLLDNYKKVTELEIGLLKEIKSRKAVNSRNIPEPTNAENYFVNKVIAYFQKGSKYFSDDYDFQMRYFNFAKLFSDHQNLAVSMIKDLISAFGDKQVEVYRKAASLYFYLQQYDEARKVLLSGQIKFPKAADIYLDLLELELRSKEKKTEELNDRLKQYIDLIVTNDIGRRFLEETILVTYIQFNLRNVAEYGLEKLTSTYEEVMSHVFAAKWELRVNQDNTADENEPPSKEAVDKAIKRLKYGLLVLPTNQKPEMWEAYISFTKNIASTDPNMKDYMTKALDEAEKSRAKLTVEHFLDLINRHKEDPGIAILKLEKGLDLYPDSDAVRIMYLKLLMKARRWAKVAIEFDKALSKLGNNTLRLWEAYVTGLNLMREEDIEAVLRRGVRDPNPDVAVEMKAKYCLWMGVNYDLERTREWYFSVANTPPYSNKMHKEMFQLERVNINDQPDIEIMNRILSLWQEQFGTVDKEVYLRRIEMLYEREEPGYKEKIQQVAKQAMSKLKDPKTVASFKANFESFEKMVKLSGLSADDDLEDCEIPTEDDFNRVPLPNAQVS